MSPHTVPLPGKELLRRLLKLGFKLLRVKGSHHFVAHEDGRRTTIPIHVNDDLPLGIYKQILRDVEISDSEIKRK